MAVQLPDEKLGVAIGVLVYSFFCLFCSVLMVWLVCVHRERASYVALISISTGLGSAGSIAQQLHTIVRWRDIKTQQHTNALANVGNPELALAGQSAGLDLVLFYIQFYSYQVTAMATFFWAAALAQSIFQLSFIESFRGKANPVSKVIAIILPAIMLSLLRIDAIQTNTVLFIGMADFLLLTCISGSIIILLIILVKYIHVRRNVLSWNVNYGKPSEGSVDNVTVSSGVRPRRQSIYDKWLVVRFTIAALAMSAFQMVTIVFQVSAARRNNLDSIGTEPDLGMDRLQSDLLVFIPGVTASLLTFVVFGTTKTFRDYMRSHFVPKPLRNGFRLRHRGSQRLESEPPTPGLQFRNDAPDLEQYPAPSYQQGIRLSDIHVDRQRNGGGAIEEWPIKGAPTSAPNGRMTVTRI